MNGHPTREEDFDLYALGAMDGEEMQALEAHLAGCAACTRKLAEARGRVSMLAGAATQVAPPSGAKERLMRRIHENAVSAGTPERLGAESRSLFGRWWLRILAPAAIALAVATVVLWREDIRLDRELTEIRTAIKANEKKYQDARNMVDTLTASDTMTVALKPTKDMPDAKGSVKYNARLGMVAYATELPMPAADKSYQLWLVPTTGNPISVGVFRPDETGKNGLAMASVQAGTAPKAFAITLEPLGGMPQPTGSMVLLGPAI
jgi:anti-sigma-K factor RskA